MVRHVFAVLLAALSLMPVSAAAQGDKDTEISAGGVPISDEARRLFKIGVTYLDDPDGARYEEAYRAFKAAYAESPSPKILGNLGLTAMKLERDQEAIKAYTEYLEKVTDIPASLKSQIERDLMTLKGSVVPVKLTMSVGGAKITDERIAYGGSRIVNVYGVDGTTFESGFRAGVHRVTVTLDGYEPALVEFDAAPGETIDRQVTLKKKSDSDPDKDGRDKRDRDRDKDDSGPSLHPGFWAGVGISVACGAATAIMGGLSLAKNAEFDAANVGTDPARAQTLHDQVSTYNLVTDVLLGVTGAAVATTIVLYFVLPSPDGEAGATGGRSKLRVGLHGNGTATFGGSF
jgi:hypothetical protein